MNITFLKNFFPLLSVFFLLSCNQNEKKPIQNFEEIKIKLQHANKQIVKSNSNAIDAYIMQHNWTVEKTGTGLRYYIYENGNGKKITNGCNVLISYSLQLLDGRIIVDFNKPITKSIVVGKDLSETGLHEVLLLLKVGDKVKVILPPHLAFGLTGDKNIPHLATLVYDIELKKIIL